MICNLLSNGSEIKKLSTAILPSIRRDVKPVIINYCVPWFNAAVVPQSKSSREFRQFRHHPDAVPNPNIENHAKTHADNLAERPAHFPVIARHPAQLARLRDAFQNSLASDWLCASYKAHRQPLHLSMRFAHPVILE